jgi:hypothetical protein
MNSAPSKIYSSFRLMNLRSEQALRQTSGCRHIPLKDLQSFRLIIHGRYILMATNLRGLWLSYADLWSVQAHGDELQTIGVSSPVFPVDAIVEPGWIGVVRSIGIVHPVEVSIGAVVIPPARAHVDRTIILVGGVVGEEVVARLVAQVVGDVAAETGGVHLVVLRAGEDGEGRVGRPGIAARPVA